MIVVALVLVVLYFLVRTFQPAFLLRGAPGAKFEKVGGESTYRLFSASKGKVVIPTGQWREIYTGVTIAPFGVFRIGGRTFHPFGRIGLRVYPPVELKMKGLEICPAVIVGTPREIVVVGTNWKPGGPFVVHEGDLVALVEMYRIPSFTLWEMK